MQNRLKNTSMRSYVYVYKRVFLHLSIPLQYILSIMHFFIAIKTYNVKKLTFNMIIHLYIVLINFDRFLRNTASKKIYHMEIARIKLMAYKHNFHLVQFMMHLDPMIAVTCKIGTSSHTSDERRAYLPIRFM